MKMIDSLDGFLGRKILIVGDVMLDRYLYGRVSRISPEAPVPVLDYEKTDHRLGGAANVALNVTAMGGEVALIGLVGDDEEGKIFRSLLRGADMDDAGVVSVENRCTTLKTRVMARTHHLLRVDREDKSPLDHSAEILLLDRISQYVDGEIFDGVILQDYNKGVLTKNIIQETIERARKRMIPVFVDPKIDHIPEFRHCTVFKPNLHEAEKILGKKIKLDQEGLKNAAESLQEILSHSITLITLSDKGLYINEKGGKDFWIPSVPQEVADVCGAGDSVISALALSYLTGADTEVMAKIANIAGHVACRYPGVVPVRHAQLKAEILKNN